MTEKTPPDDFLSEDSLSFASETPNESLWDSHQNNLEKAIASDAIDSDQLTSIPTEVSFPFTVMIEGALSPLDRSKILSFVKNEKLGIDVKDIQLQLDSSKICLPRISEYAAVLLVQSLRDSQAVLRLFPSDSMVGPDDSDGIVLENNQPHAYSSSTGSTRIFTPSHEIPAEQIPLITGPFHPSQPVEEVLETLSASALLETSSVEASYSPEHQERVEALQRKIKVQAFVKKADAVLNFKIDLIPLSQPTSFRMVATGTAVRIKKPTSSLE